MRLIGECDSSMKQRSGGPRRRAGINNEEEGGGTNERQSLLLSGTAYCDHYGGGGEAATAVGNDSKLVANNNDKYEVSGGGGGGGLSPITARHGSSCLRKIILQSSSLLLALLSLGGLLYSYDQTQMQLSHLTTQLANVESNLQHLSSQLNKTNTRLTNDEAILAEHTSVIDRFADSVSNSDVLQQLHTLEHESKAREIAVHVEMEQTKSDITSVLLTTKHDIDTTVSTATNEINNQVTIVQSSLSLYIRTTQDQFSTENSFMIYQLAGTFTLLGCLISMWHMTSHLRAFHQPFVQRKILAILWMCPIYSITSWLCLVGGEKVEGYLGIMKDMYEAYVIYTFLSFCIAVLGRGDREAVVDILARQCEGQEEEQQQQQGHRHLSHPIPTWLVDILCCCRCFCPGRQKKYSNDQHERNRQHAESVLLQCQVCAMQFVFLRPMLTTALFVLKKIHYHGPMFGPLPFGIDDGYDPSAIYDPESGVGLYRSPQFFIVLLENLSVFLAFSGLLNFYHAVQEELVWCRPFPKFLCIKGVVFMTFWQGIVLNLLADTTDAFGGSSAGGANDDDGGEDKIEKYAKQAQHFLICLEMLGFSIAHFYCFPVDEWKPGYKPEVDSKQYADKMALGDFLQDLKLILRHRKRNTPRKSEDSISTVIEEDAEDDDDDDGTDEESQSSGKLQSLFDKYENDPIVSNRARNSLDYQQQRSSGSPRNGLTSSPSPLDDPRETFRQIRVMASLKTLNAPSELREATALLLQSSLLDSVTASLLNSKIMEQHVNSALSTDFIDIADEVAGGRGGGEEEAVRVVRQSQIDPGGYKNLRQQSQKFTVAELRAELDNKQLLDPTGEKKPSRDSLDFTTESQQQQPEQQEKDDDEEDDDKEATCEKICCSDITTATLSTETSSTETSSYLFAPPEVTNSIVRQSIWTYGPKINIHNDNSA